MRRIALLTIVVILAALLAGCGGNKAPNQLSEAPTSLQQLRADGTSIDVGDATDDQSVILKATVSGSSDDQMQLEVELQRLDELARGFSGEPTHQSGWTSSGAIASILVDDLIGGDYQWRARTKDEHGATSSWVSASGNPDSEVDFWHGFAFAIITDLHIGRGYSDYGGGDYDDNGVEGEDYYLTERLQQAIDWIKDSRENQGIEFVVVLGDISDSGEYSELQKAKELLDELNDPNGDGDTTDAIPYIPLIGNHDVWPYTGDKNAPSGWVGKNFNDVFEGQFNFLADFFGAGNWMKQGQLVDRAPRLLQNYAFAYGAINFVALDCVSREGTDRGAKVNGVLHEQTEAWLEAVGHLPNEGRPVILFSHHPLVQNEWNMMGPAFPSADYGELVEVIERVEDNGIDVLASFAGHIHSATAYGTTVISDFNLEYRDEYYELPVYVRAIVAPGTPSEMNVWTTEAMDAGSNQEQEKGIVRVVKVGGGQILDPSIMGFDEPKALNPDITGWECEREELPDGEESFRAKIYADTFTKIPLGEYYEWHFEEDGEVTIISTAEPEVFYYCDEPRTYNVTLWVRGQVGEATVSEYITEEVTVP